MILKFVIAVELSSTETLLKHWVIYLHTDAKDQCNDSNGKTQQTSANHDLHDVWLLEKKVHSKTFCSVVERLSKDVCDK